jgi:hypothetical protein
MTAATHPQNESEGALWVSRRRQESLFKTFERLAFP